MTGRSSIGVGELKLPGDLAAPPVGLAAVAHQEVADRLAGEERIVLPQVAEPELAAADDFAGVELFVAQQDAAEGRFAGAVAADEADLLIVGQRAARAVEQVLVAVAFVGVLSWRTTGTGKILGASEVQRYGGR